MKNTFTSILFLFLTHLLLAQAPGNWTSKGSNITADDRSIQGISVIDSNNVWAIAYYLFFDRPFREFTRTSDGGETWQSGIIDPEDGGDFASIIMHAASDRVAWVGMTDMPAQSKGRIYKTTDGGQTWAQQFGSFNLFGKAVVGIHFFDEQEGFAFGSAGTGDPTVDSLHIWKTQDGGDSWRQLENNFLPPRLSGEGVWVPYSNNIFEVKGDTIWFPTRRGRIWRSINRGNTWTVHSLDPANTLFDDLISVSFENSQKGIAVGTQGIYRTKDGGVNWEFTPPISATAHYQIQHVPNTENTYFLSYENAFFFFEDIQHAYTLDGGDNWIKVKNNNNIEVFQFYSPTGAWGGALVDSPTQGGMYQWAGGFLQNYAATGKLEKSSPYSITTPRQLPNDFGWDLKIKNIGKLPIDIESTIRVIKPGFNDKIEETVALAAQETTEIPVLLPNEIGKYSCSVTSKSTQDESNFFYSAFEKLEIHESIMAKDDGVQSGGLGFGFGDPSWYGYYGSAFDLVQPDTLTAITIFISPSSDLNGSIHLTVTNFGEDGQPDQEIFHSEELFLADYNIRSNDLDLTYELEEPLVLSKGKYIFAAGQDTLQGIIGFSFDNSNIQPDGFWLTSPVAGGGYPWENAENREVLMIRPHFKPSDFLTSTQTYLSQLNAKVYPNPSSEAIQIEMQLPTVPEFVQLELIDITGKVVRKKQLSKNTLINENWSLEELPNGIYWIKIWTNKGFWTKKVVKN